jgi:hypothetical protein
MSVTIEQAGLWTIPPGSTENIAFPFTLGSATVASKTVSKTLLRGLSTDSPLTLGTATESAGTVSVPVTSVTEGQLWEIQVTIITSESPTQTFISQARVLCEARL